MPWCQPNELNPDVPPWPRPRPPAPSLLLPRAQPARRPSVPGAGGAGSSPGSSIKASTARSGVRSLGGDGPSALKLSPFWASTRTSRRRATISAGGAPPRHASEPTYGELVSLTALRKVPGHLGRECQPSGLGRRGGGRTEMAYKPEFARAAPPALRYSHACRGPSGPSNRTGLTLAVPHTPPALTRWLAEAEGVGAAACDPTRASCERARGAGTPLPRPSPLVQPW